MKAAVFSYTNRRGVTYYVHQMQTKHGARRYAAKRSAQGALPELPAGLEIVENVNGQVSVRVSRARDILPLEERLVQQALETHGRRDYRLETKGRDIIIHEPLSNVEEIADALSPTGVWGNLGLDLDKMMRRKVGDAAWEEHLRQQKEQVRQDLQRRMRYGPVIRFRLDDPVQRRFSVERMCYLGEGGWLGLTFGMTLADACDRYMPLLGTEELFEEF